MPQPILPLQSTTMMDVFYEDRPVDPWFLETFFPVRRTFTTETITTDMVKQGQPLAPFVGPCKPAPTISKEGFTRKSYAPPYIKMKCEYGCCDSFDLRAGENPVLNMGEQVNLAARRDQQIVSDMDRLDKMIHRREIWMGIQAMVYGGYTVEGEDYPTAYIDLCRDACLSMTLTGDQVLTNECFKLGQFLEDMACKMEDVGGGSPRLVLGDKKGIQCLMWHDEICKALNLRNGYDGDLDLNPRTARRMGATYKGRWGDFEFWQWNDRYQDQDGVYHSYIPEKTLLLIDPDEWEGRRGYGKICHVTEPGASDRFPHQWPEPDGSTLWTQLDSAPLLWPRNPNAAMRITSL